jgi:hypothetical protein
MEVRVVCEPPATNCPETDYVHVRTCPDPDDGTVTLATIERVVGKSENAARRLVRRVKTLIARQRMSQSDALLLATNYAQRKRIPVVYAVRG